MDDINLQVCNSNYKSNTLKIDTTLYSDFNYFILPNYIRVFTIIGLLSIIFNGLLYGLLYGIIVKSAIVSNKILVPITVFVLVITILGLSGFSLLIGGSIFNIIERIRIFNVPSLGANVNCNISLQYDSKSELFNNTVSKIELGFVKFSSFLMLILLLGMHIYIWYYLIANFLL